MEHKCVYAVCNKCYSNNQQKSLTRGNGNTRSSRNTDKDSDEKVCNHTQLEIFTDTLYYREKAIEEKKQEEDIYFPFVCVKCKNQFCS